MPIPTRPAPSLQLLAQCQPSDTQQKLNYEKLAALTTWTTELVRKLDALDLPATPLEADRTAGFEAASITRALSPAVLAQLELKPPQTRADVDAFVSRLLRETLELG